jgi:non-specific serine/threonine protein kinase
VRLAGSLWRFWWFYGHHSEGRRWLERSLAVPASDHTPSGHSTRANARFGAAHLAAHLADYRAAIVHIEDGLALWRQAGNERGVATALQRLGLYLVHVGETERGIPLSEESVILARSAGDPFTLAMAIHALAVATWFAGQLERAAEHSEESLALVREIDYTGGIAFNLRFMGRVVGQLGDSARATRLVEEALTMSQGLGDKGGIAEGYGNLARIARSSGDHGRAIELLRISLPAHRELGERWLIVFSLQDLAGAMTVRGARAIVTPAAGSAGTTEAREHLLAATRLFGAAETLREACGVVLPAPLRTLADRDLSVLRQHLDEVAFGQASTEGRAMSFEQSTEYALTLMTPPEPTPAEPASRAAGRPTDAEAAPLTPREREVAVLVARGCTNREIARELVLSERTVDSHVRNIMGKLEINTRAQIAAWAVRQGLGGPR